MQIKTKISPDWSKSDYYQKDKDNKCWQECEEKATFAHCWWLCKIVYTLQTTVPNCLKIQKKKKNLSYDAAIPLLGI